MKSAARPRLLQVQEDAPVHFEAVVHFTRERETPNTILYRENGTNGKDKRGKIGQLYVMKSAFGEFVPEEVTITLEYDSPAR
jgi:hypothetical protein